MGLFDRFKKDKVDPLKIYCPIKGKVVPIESLDDKTFAGKVMGDGVAIIPSEGKVYSPVNGTINALLDTNHAYGITSDEGYDLLIHIGQDTVKLNGEGFKALVKQDQKVKKGDLLGTFDIDLIKSKGYNLATPVIVIDGDYKINNKTNLNDINVGDDLITVNK